MININGNDICCVIFMNNVTIDSKQWIKQWGLFRGTQHFGEKFRSFAWNILPL